MRTQEREGCEDNLGQLCLSRGGERANHTAIRVATVGQEIRQFFTIRTRLLLRNIRTSKRRAAQWFFVQNIRTVSSEDEKSLVELKRRI